jgi:alanyl-tRNA synthetase
MALFGEKYGESVRTISIMGESRISYELCGGTHVNQTGDIGSFIILNESSVAAGIRRIEAITGVKAYEVIRQRMKILRQISSKLLIPMENSFDRVNNLITENEKKIKEVGKLQEELASIEFENNKNKDLQKKDQTTVYITTIVSIETESLRKLADKFRIQNPSSILAIGTKEINSERVTLLISITEDLVKNKGLNAVELVKEAGALIGGGGGGKPTLAQAGGNNGSNLPLALNKIRELVNLKI